MPENLRCTECGEVTYGFVSGDPRPVDRDDCPNCGGTEFEVV